MGLIEKIKSKLVWILGGVSLILLLLFKREYGKRVKSEIENELADLKKDDAVLAVKSDHLDEKINEKKNELNKPIDDKQSAEDYWKKK